MCLNPISVPVRECGRIVSYNVVPCGKCAECVDRRQKDMMQVFLGVANRSSSIVFATFTYNDEHLPFLWSLFDHETEQALYQSFDLSFVESHYCESDPVSVVSAPSLRRRDWRLWLKSARVRYQREHGKSLPKFSYSCIGEYGKVNFRPHYHALFFNLSLAQVQELCNSWVYGFSYCQLVDRSQPLTGVCRYMAKYLYKGLFEAPDVQYRLVEKPRVMNSRGLVKLDQRLIDWLTGKDLGLDLDTKFVSDELCQRLISRRKVLIDDFSYNLGKHFLDKVFKRYAYDPEGKPKFVNTPLQDALSAFIRKQSNALFDRTYFELARSVGREKAASIVSQEQRNKELAKASRDEGLCSSLQEYYRRSKL